jgi:hypothetical protein
MPLYVFQELNLSHLDQVLDGTDLAGTEYWMPHSLDSPYFNGSGA